MKNKGPTNLCDNITETSSLQDVFAFQRTSNILGRKVLNYYHDSPVFFLCSLTTVEVQGASLHAPQN